MQKIIKKNLVTVVGWKNFLLKPNQLITHLHSSKVDGLQSRWCISLYKLLVFLKSIWKIAQKCVHATVHSEAERVQIFNLYSDNPTTILMEGTMWLAVALVYLSADNLTLPAVLSSWIRARYLGVWHKQAELQNTGFLHFIKHLMEVETHQYLKLALLTPPWKETV